MRVFLDTNVWISAFTASGICNEVLERCLSEHLLLTSGFVMREVEKTLGRKFKLSSADVNEIVSFIRLKARQVAESPIKAVCRDPQDDHILAAAKGGNSDFLVTGDEDLLILKVFENIRILKPGGFLRAAKDPADFPGK